MNTDELPTRFAVEFFVLRVAQDKKAKDFFYRRATYKGRKYKKPRKPLSPPGLVCHRKEKKKRKTKEGSLSPQEGDVKNKEKKKTKEGEKVAPRRQGSVCPQPRISFFGSRVFGF